MKMLLYIESLKSMISLSSAKLGSLPGLTPEAALSEAQKAFGHAGYPKDS